MKVPGIFESDHNSTAGFRLGCVSTSGGESARGRVEWHADAHIVDCQLEEECAQLLGTQLAGDVAQRQFIGDQCWLFDPASALLRPVVVGVFIVEPNENGFIDGHRLQVDQRPS